MPIVEYKKLSLVDYTGNTCAVVYFSKCNLRCVYCHNPKLVLDELMESRIDEKVLFREIIQFLSKRKNIIDGVVLTGGEPLLHDRIIKIAGLIKDLGLKVKLDTNGVQYGKLKELLHNDLVDYVALDYKGDRENIKEITGISNESLVIENWFKSFRILLESEVDFELRTTLVKGFHNTNNLISMAKEIIHSRDCGDFKWYLQSFRRDEKVLSDYSKDAVTLHAYSDQEVSEMLELLKKLGFIVEKR